MDLRTPLVAVTALTLGGAFFLASTPSATAAPNPCGIDGWFVNADEADREPERTTAGFVFEGADLIHHNAPAGLTTAELESGDYTASPAPDQASFFSVEVAGDDGGYATLRYNRLTHLWNMVTGGQFYEHADPDKLVDLPPSKRSHTVVRFGVGYTKNPPGTVKTTVTAVSFQGEAYAFTCSPTTQSPSASATTSSTPSATSTTFPGSSSTPTASVTTTAIPSSTASATTNSPTPSASPRFATCADAFVAGYENIAESSPWYRPELDSDSDGLACESDETETSSADGSLPLTGASAIGMAAAGVLLIGVGIAGILYARRRRH